MKFKKFDLEHRPGYYWLRSANSKYSYLVCYVNIDGRAYNNCESCHYDTLHVCLII